MASKLTSFRRCLDMTAAVWPSNMYSLVTVFTCLLTTAIHLSVTIAFCTTNCYMFHQRPMRLQLTVSAAGRVVCSHTWVYSRYRARAICAGRLHSSCRLTHRLTTRSASTDISVCTAPALPLPRLEHHSHQANLWGSVCKSQVVMSVESQQAPQSGL